MEDDVCLNTSVVSKRPPCRVAYAALDLRAGRTMLLVALAWPVTGPLRAAGGGCGAGRTAAAW